LSLSKKDDSDMPLFLAEFNTDAGSRAELAGLLDRVAAAVGRSGGSVIEAQAAVDLKKTYVVVEHQSQEEATQALAEVRPAAEIAAVRLVGATLDEVKAIRGAARYLVEWDLPAGLTMDRYLTRKAEKSPLYAQVPDVKFLRTYVREDMAKCLCFYDAADESAVKRAREVVGAPIHRLTRVEGGTDAR
jgi:hypothetical protein